MLRISIQMRKCAFLNVRIIDVKYFVSLIIMATGIHIRQIIKILKNRKYEVLNYLFYLFYETKNKRHIVHLKVNRFQL